MDVAHRDPPSRVATTSGLFSVASTMMMTYARTPAHRPASFAREEQAGYMLRVAAELLAVGAVDPRAKARYDEAARHLGHALHARDADVRAILAASPLVRDTAGVARPMVSMICGNEDDLESGVRSAMTLFLVSDWILAS
jgi:hypothetical protein